MKFLLILGLMAGLLIALPRPATAQPINYSKTAVVRAYEVGSNQHLIVSYGDGKTQSSPMPGRAGRKD